VNIPLPDNAPDYLWVLAILVSGFGTWYTTKVQKQQGGVVQEVHEQVTNTHSTNLRDDLDRIHKDILLIRGEVTELHAAVSDLRGRQYDLEDIVRSND